VSDEANVELAQALMSGFGTQDGFLSMLTDEVVIVPSLVIDEGTLRGGAAVRRWLEAIEVSYDEYRADGDGYEPGASGRVLVSGSILVRPRGVAAEHARPAFWVITIEDGRVAAIVSYANEECARKAAGL
jgi:hypothetical protein